MRWPFRRRRGITSTAARPTRWSGPVPSAPARHWRAAHPLRVSIRRRPPVLAAVLRLPDVAGTRTILRALPPLRHRERVPRGPAGRVTGVVSVPEPDAVVAHVVDSPAPPVVQEWVDAAPVRRRRAPAPGWGTDAEDVEPAERDQVLIVDAPRRRRPPAVRPARRSTMTEATEEFVAPPVEPAEPFRSITRFDRLAAQYEEMGLENALGMLGMVGPGAMSLADPPPPAAEAPDRAPSPATRPRPTLGQSRRMGVGTPRPATVDTSASPADPEPAHRDPGPAERPAPARSETRPPAVDPPSQPPPPDPPADRTPEAPHAPPRAARPSLPHAPLFPRPTRRGADRAREPEPTPLPSAGSPPPTGAGPPPAEPAPPTDRPDQDLPAAEPVGEPPALRPPGRPEPVTRPGPAAPGTAALVHLPAAAPPRQPATPESPPAPGHPGRAGRAEPVAPPGRSTGPVYRAVPANPAAAPPRRVEKSARDWVDTPVPSEVVSAFRHQLGVDVEDVPVLRGRAVAQRAADLGARAFAQGGRVYLPDEAGELDDRATRALLAHELTHAVQQRVLGEALPAEDSAEGRELEATAHAVEQWVLGQGAAPVTLVHRVPRDRVHLPEAAPAPPAAGSPDLPQRALLDAPPRPDVEPGPTGPAETAPGEQSWTLANGFSAAAADPARSPEPVPQRANQLPAPAVDLAGVYRQLAGLRSEVTELRARDERKPDAEPIAVDRLAGRLYHAIRSRLRAELIIDRERAGLLADIG